ncbi:hypothetical protein ACSBM8_11645 [Sphingomonas sp. ASY06-1R]|uniref:hypothetical protein n=1 Tax=Sphingomonas sp. ASY06-1R TaxID=3445771 RepID=UPI003FA2447B
MSTTTTIVIAVIVVIALLFLFLIFGRKQHVTLGDAAPIVRPAPLQRAGTPAPPVTPVVPPEGYGVGTEIADAVEDVVDQFMGIQSHATDVPAAPGDMLTQLKGLGPKAASLLHDLGVTRFEQIANWNDADVAAIDARMGAFKGRIARDRWVEQARLLASGNTEAFEAEFGKLGS